MKNVSYVIAGAALIAGFVYGNTAQIPATTTATAPAMVESTPIDPSDPSPGVLIKVRAPAKIDSASDQSTFVTV